MKNSKFGSGVGFGRRTMVVEQLEHRCVLAGNVAVSVAGGNLLVFGDNSDNAVLVQQVGPGSYAVSGFDFAASGLSGFQAGPTKINGSPDGTVVVTKVTGDIIIDLKKGNDALGVGNDVSTLQTLAEDCFGNGFGLGSGSGGGGASGVSSGRFSAPHNLVINGGDGNDFIVTNADVAGSEVITAGNGNNGVAVGTTPTAVSDNNSGDLQIGGDLTIVTGKNADNVCLDFATVKGLVNVQSGEGDDTVDLHEFDAGHLLLGTAGGNDTVAVTTFDTDHEAVIDSGSGNDSVVVSDFSAGQGFGANPNAKGGGNVVVTTDAGNDGLDMENFQVDSLVVDTGSGNDGVPVTMDARIRQADVPIAAGPITIAQATVKYQATIVTGAGNDALNVNTLQAHDLVVDTGAGNDQAELFGYKIAGNMTAVTGAGNDSLYLHGDGGDAEVDGNLVVDTGAGNDFAHIIDQMVGNDLVISLGAGNDSLDLEGVQVGLDAVLDAGAGDDVATIANVTVTRNATLLMGAGNDTLTLTDNSIGGKATLDGGPGKNDTLTDGGGNTFGTEFDTGFEHKN